MSHYGMELRLPECKIFQNNDACWIAVKSASVSNAIILLRIECMILQATVHIFGSYLSSVHQSFLFPSFPCLSQC